MPSPKIPFTGNAGALDAGTDSGKVATVPIPITSMDASVNSVFAQMTQTGSAALHLASDFATSDQGIKADTALQSAAAFATAAQGAKADTALQSIAARSFTNNPSRTIQTVAAAANGWQISSTRDSQVGYSCSVTTTATIGGASVGYIALEICSTNSTTAANWLEVSRIQNSQTITLAIALQSIQVVGSALWAIVPAGWFVRLRSVQTSGTPTFAFVSGQEIVL